MASYKHQGKPSNYRDYLDTRNLSQVGLKCPRAILEAITTSSEDEVLMAVAALDLYLCNRAPDLYTNYEAIEVLLGEAATLWETRLTDRSLIGVVKKLMATLRGYTLPFPIVEALDKLHFIISNNSINSICDLHHALQPEDWDLLVDDGLSDSDRLLDDDDLLVNDI
ncbi:Aste57867_4921 [Aphanomyces stellatus]|uniref:Aste57867_4921 protein n=1 Tax=Aphanomyces stellatus TaxID=120398 RepID=A0A485KH40_9STRA|nr:hypothetical protein As57867_004908 [Aphanomyces stellatus]VFT82011.1 Aste57867_4921 [Aphanomyces stellatus]